MNRVYGKIKFMKIGIFDSGLGGLLVARSIRKVLPQYDYVYFGDTKRVPYGNKSHQAIFEFTKESIDYLFRTENCALVIIACNTASARALHRIQKEYLIKNFKNRRILGVLIPAAEVASKYDRVGILATTGTVNSETFPVEINKLSKRTKIFQNAAPMLVPLIEAGEKTLARPFLIKYLKPFQNKELNALVLGCTHYPILKSEIKKLIDKNIKIISQDEIIPAKLKDYLNRHNEIEKKLSKKRTVKFITTDETTETNMLIKKWFSKLV